MVKKKMRRSPSGNPVYAQALIHVILAIASVICLYPLINVVAKSISDGQAILRNPMMVIPENLTIEAYKYIMKTPVLLKSFAITTFATVVGTLMNLIVTITCAYSLSRVKAPGAKFLLWMTVIPMLFGAGLVPTYVLLSNLKLLNNVWVLVIPSLLNPMNALLVRNFFWGIPDSLSEAAMIDGATEGTVLTKIILPLSKPIIATIGLFYAVGHWNDYFTGVYFISDNTKWPLQVLLRSIIVDFNAQGMGNMSAVGGQGVQSGTMLQPENIKAATIVFATIPIVCVYPFLQKYFVKGVVVGAVKG